MSSDDRRYPARPIVGVGAVILVDASTPVDGLPPPAAGPYGVVLVKRRFEPLAGEWSLPGGKVEIGETLAAGVAREVLEETGLVVTVGAIVGVFDRIIRDHAQGVRHHYVLIDFLCRPTAGRLIAGSDAAEVAVADPRALGWYAVSAEIVAVVDKAIAVASTPLAAVSGGGL